MTITPLGFAWRWRPCEICGSHESRRIAVDTGLGQRVICVRVEACDRRIRYRERALELHRQAKRKRGELVVLAATR